jgi:hypothetical protein
MENKITITKENMEQYKDIVSCNRLYIEGDIEVTLSFLKECESIFIGVNSEGCKLNLPLLEKCNEIDNSCGLLNAPLLEKCDKIEVQVLCEEVLPILNLPSLTTCDCIYIHTSHKPTYLTLPKLKYVRIICLIGDSMLQAASLDHCNSIHMNNEYQKQQYGWDGFYDGNYGSPILHADNLRSCSDIILGERSIIHMRLVSEFEAIYAKKGSVLYMNNLRICDRIIIQESAPLAHGLAR